MKKFSFKLIEENFIYNILFRYIFLIFLVIILLSNFLINFLILIFTNLSYYFLLLFTQVQNNGLVFFENEIAGELILQNGVNFYIVQSCIAISSYILILIIFLSLKIKFKTLFKIIFKSFLVFSIFNLIRIFFLMFISIKFGQVFFDKFHLIFYEFLSGVVTALIILYYIKKEKIKKVFPFITDIKLILKNK